MKKLFSSAFYTRKVLLIMSTIAVIVFGIFVYLSEQGVCGRTMTAVAYTDNCEIIAVNLLPTTILFLASLLAFFIKNDKAFFAWRKFTVWFVVLYIIFMFLTPFALEGDFIFSFEKIWLSLFLSTLYFFYFPYKLFKHYN